MLSFCPKYVLNRIYEDFKGLKDDDDDDWRVENNEEEKEQE
jgi:hypothetical protein